MSSDAPAPDAVSNKLDESCRRVLTLIENIRRNQSTADNEQNKRSYAETSETQVYRRQKRPSFSRQSLAIDDNYNVISLLGERGSGKTTLMCEILEKLNKSKKDILLSPIVPERFMEKDYLIGWVLAALQDWVEFLGNQGIYDADDDEYPQKNELNELREAFEKVQMEGSILQALNHNQLQINDLFEYSQDRIELFSGNFNLQKQLRKFFDKLTGKPFSRLFIGKNPLVIIPIDDADLTPRHVFPIFQQISSFLAHPRVLVLISGDMRTFLHALRTHISNTSNEQPIPVSLSKKKELRWPYPNTMDSPGYDFLAFREDFADRLLTKYLPQQYRVTLAPWSLREKLAFKPGNADADIRLLLEKIGPIPTPRKKVMDYIFPLDENNVNVEECPLIYSYLLPHNLRQLRQAYEILQSLSGSQTREKDNPQFLTRAIHFLVHELSSEERLILGKLTDDEFCDGTKSIGNTMLPMVNFNSAGLKLDYAIRAAIPYVDVKRKIQLKPQYPARPCCNYRGKELSPEFTALIYFLLEAEHLSESVSFLFLGKAFHCGETSPLLKLSFGNCQLANFLTYPHWNAFTDEFYCVAAWNRMLGNLQNQKPFYGKTSEEFSKVFDFLIYQHIQIIFRVQISGKIPVPLAASELDDTLENTCEFLEKWFDEVEKYLKTLQKIRKSKPSLRERAFIRWLLVEFPITFFPGIETPAFYKIQLSRWEALTRLIFTTNIQTEFYRPSYNMRKVLLSMLGTTHKKVFWNQFKKICQNLGVSVSISLFRDLLDEITPLQRDALNNLLKPPTHVTSDSGSAQPPQGTK